jgi:hypothetical protein
MKDCDQPWKRDTVPSPFQGEGQDEGQPSRCQILHGKVRMILCNMQNTNNAAPLTLPLPKGERDTIPSPFQGEG